MVEEGETLAALRRRLDRVGPDLVEGVSLAVARGRLDEAHVDAFSASPTVLSLGARVAHLLTEGAHLSALAGSRLRECGVTDLEGADLPHWLAGR